MFFQTSLKIWKDDYSHDFCSLESYDILSQILSCDSPIVLTGPKKSGKTHLAFKVCSLRNGEFFILDSLSDSQIIDYYDFLKASNAFAIFILSSSFVCSRDVDSRLSSLLRFSISQLSQENFLFFLRLRLDRVGLKLDDSLIRYSFSRLPCSYLAVDSFISFLLSSKSISFKTLKVFFDSFTFQD